MPGVVVGVGHAGDVQTTGGERQLVGQSLHSPLQLVEDVDIVVHHQSVVRQVTSPVRLSDLDTPHQLLQLSPPRSPSPGQVLLHLDPLHSQQLLLPENFLLVRPFLGRMTESVSESPWKCDSPQMTRISDVMCLLTGLLVTH